MLSVLVRGRLAWIAAIVLGVILIIVGAVASSTFWLVAGIVIAVIGGIFLVLSLMTRGATD